MLSKPSAPTPSPDEFAEIQKLYFAKLDLRVSENRLKEVPSFSARLSSLADWERWKVKSGNSKSAAERERAGLIFIYDALMIMNNTEGVARETLPYLPMKEARRFSGPFASPQVELTARAQYSIDELRLASQLRPEDKRIDSWLAGANAALERIRDGAVSDAAIDVAFSAIKSRPTFNLLTALVLFQDEDASTPRFEHLVKSAQEFVDNAAHGSDPCQTRPQDCTNGPNALYNIQAASVILGDIFLRRAEYFLKKDDINSASQMAAYAEGTYAHLDKPPEAAEVTARWPDRDVMDLRRARMDSIHQALVPPDSLLSNTNYHRVYECASCHGRAP